MESGAVLEKKRGRLGSRISVGMLSLGCPKTLVDSELILGMLDKKRYRIAEHISDCEIALLNTCSFIEEAKRESIDHILRLAELKQEGSIKAIVVLGCLVQRYQKALEAELGEVDAFVGTGDYEELNWVLDRVARHKRLSKVGHAPGFLYTADAQRVALTPIHTRYLKISEGCDHTCSFCTIPLFRGRHRSRNLEDVALEGARLVGEGARELVLTGQDTTYFGRDTEGRFLLPDLLDALNRIESLRWIRILYAYPSCVTDQLIDRLKGLDKVCHYVDMPLQHVSDRMLRGMRRGTTKSAAYRLIEKLRSRIPDIAIRTTFIVGFPGETDADFQELLDFMEWAKFDRLGMFTFSPEDQSAAVNFPRQVPQAVKEARFDQGMALQQKISRDNNERLIGKVFSVILEECAGSEGGRRVFRGRTYMDAPEVDGFVYVAAPEGQAFHPGQFVLARTTGAREYDLTAEYLRDD